MLAEPAEAEELEGTRAAGARETGAEKNEKYHEEQEQQEDQSGAAWSSLSFRKSWRSGKIRISKSSDINI